MAPKLKDPPRRIQKTLYLPEDLEAQLRIQAAELKMQQSDLVAAALTAYFASSRPGKARKSR